MGGKGGGDEEQRPMEQTTIEVVPPHVEPVEQSHLSWWQDNSVILISVLAPLIFGIWMYKLKMKEAAREREEDKREDAREDKAAAAKKAAKTAAKKAAKKRE